MDERGVILLVEDEQQILDANRRILEGAGHTVLTAATLSDARKCLRAAVPDVVVLDVILPDGSGLDFIGELREFCEAPVLLLTLKDDRDDILAGLRAGGNDYITKPYDIDELLERVAAFLRLMSGRSKLPEKLCLDALELNIHASQAFVHEKNLQLTQKEFGVLLFLARSAEKTVGVKDLYESVWHAPLLNDTVTLKTTISHLRNKLAGSGWRILFIRRGGYCLTQASKN